MARGANESAKDILPFWAPTSLGAHGRLPADTNQGHNKKVNDVSKINKLLKLESDFEKVNCWTKDEFFKHKLNLMMTYDDAKNCTFTPSIGNKMPKSYKELILDQYHSWATNYLNSKATSFTVFISLDTLYY